jgi:hypothetical protein
VCVCVNVCVYKRVGVQMREPAQAIANELLQQEALSQPRLLQLAVSSNEEALIRRYAQLPPPPPRRQRVVLGHAHTLRWQNTGVAASACRPFPNGLRSSCPHVPAPKQKLADVGQPAAGASSGAAMRCFREHTAVAAHGGLLVSVVPGGVCLPSPSTAPGTVF